MAKVVTLILAGGQGSRLYPLTKVRSKPAVPIAGRFRLIDVAMSNSIHSGFRRIFVLTQFASESLHRHIFVTYRFDNFTKDFVTILSAQQTLENRNWYQGTADAVRKNIHFFERVGDLVLILSGDHLYKMDYRPFVEFHRRRKAEVTIGVVPVRAEQVPEFGVMKMNERGRITDFAEKPRTPAEIDRMRTGGEVFERFGTPAAGRTHLASMGVYLFNTDALVRLLSETPAADFGREIIPAAIPVRKVYGYFYDDYWEDIGTIPSFFEAHLDMTAPLPRFNFYDEDRPIFTHPRFLPGSKITCAEIEDSILCDGSVVDRSRLRRSIVGIRSRIGGDCVLERAVVMGADYFESEDDRGRNRALGRPDVGIGRGCEIRNAIVDKNARIGQGVRLVNARGLDEEEAETHAIVGGIVIVPKDTVIPDGTVI